MMLVLWTNQNMPPTNIGHIIHCPHRPSASKYHCHHHGMRIQFSWKSIPNHILKIHCFYPQIHDHGTPFLYLLGSIFPLIFNSYYYTTKDVHSVALHLQLHPTSIRATSFSLPHSSAPITNCNSSPNFLFGIKHISQSQCVIMGLKWRTSSSFFSGISTNKSRGLIAMVMKTTW